MKKRIGKIVYVIIFVFVAFLMIKALMQSNSDNLSVISDALVEASSMDEANDGKLVMLTGTIDVDKDTVVGEEFDLDLPQAVLLEREVYQLRWVDETKDSNRPKESEILQKSSIHNDGVNARWKIAQSPFDKAVVSEKESYQNKPCNLKDNLVARKAYVKGLEIDATKLVTSEFKECYESVLKYDGTVSLSVGEAKFVSDEACFMTGEEIGDYKIIYRYLDPNDVGTVTIVGKQNGSKLEEYVDGNVFVYDILKGELSKEEYLQKLEEDYGMSKASVAVTFVILIIIGLFVFRDQLPIKNRKSQDDNE